MHVLRHPWRETRNVRLYSHFNKNFLQYSLLLDMGYQDPPANFIPFHLFQLCIYSHSFIHSTNLYKFLICVIIHCILVNKKINMFPDLQNGV